MTALFRNEIGHPANRHQISKLVPYFHIGHMRRPAFVNKRRLGNHIPSFRLFHMITVYLDAKSFKF